MNSSTTKLTRVERLMEFALLAVFVALFAYACNAWLQASAAERTDQSTGFVFLTAGMVLQPVASLARERSRKAAYALLLASLALLVLALWMIAS
jgi:peptidoglycan/LPS O-acetylase OafA/YrhL